MCHVILCGYKGCGKSTWGQQLAARTGKAFIDLDDQLPSAQDVGLTEFRSQERMLAQGLVLDVPTVVATGGGTVVDPRSMAHLRALGTVVYLRASPELLLQRLQGKTPPLFLDPTDLERSFWRHYASRILVYEAVADVIIEGLCGK